MNRFTHFCHECHVKFAKATDFVKHECHHLMDMAKLFLAAKEEEGW